MAENWTTRDWSAWLDVMPGPDRQPSVHVAGTCVFPTTGYTAELRYTEPQGINPRYLLLDLIVIAPEVGEETITEQLVSFSRPATVNEYEFATITGIAENIPISQAN
jgi:hypothetical protein